MDHTTDVIYFGALKPCETCKDGHLIFNGNSAYVCDGNISEWARCDNVSKLPKRSSVKIPKYIQENHSFLAKKFKVKDRAIKPVPAHLIPKAVVKKQDADDVDG